MNTSFEIFFSYAHEDEDLMNDVRRQLIVYERNGRILKWHDRMIPPGADWRNHIDFRLERARIILPFMSPHFIESHYCYEVEGEAAMRRRSVGGRTGMKHASMLHEGLCESWTNCRRCGWIPRLMAERCTHRLSPLA